jgi:glycosyltransferase involved in cell wall biosynthesis
MTKLSICIATHNKASILKLVLNSICSQVVPFSYEIVVVDDASQDSTRMVCSGFPVVRYVRVNREPGYRNPSVPRNVSLRMAQGKFLIMQSDDVVHITPDAIERLVGGLSPGTFSIATVYNALPNGERVPLREWPTIVQLTGTQLPRPFFFLGCILREHIYRVGGHDERYVGPGSDENALADALMHGLGLRPHYIEDVVGHHIDHPRPSNLRQLTRPGVQMLRRRRRACQRGEESWLAPGAPWPM